MQVDLAGQLAVVTGADMVFGAAISAACEANGATVERLTSADLGPSKSAATALDCIVQRSGAPQIVIDGSSAGDLLDSAACQPRAANSLILAAGEVMANQGGGRILTLLSVLGLLPARSEPLASAMHAALAATIRVHAMKLAPRRVLVNGLAIGSVGVTQPYLVSHVPMSRRGRVEEVAAAAMFLVDPQNTYTVGHILNVDGGWQAGFARDF